MRYTFLDLLGMNPLRPMIAFGGDDSSSDSSSSDDGGGGSTPMPTDTSVDFSLPGSDDTLATIDYGSADEGITGVSYTNVHTGETFDNAGDLHASYGFDDDDGPSTPVVTTGPSGYPSLDATAGVTTTPDVEDPLDAFGGAGPDIGADTDYVESGVGYTYDPIVSVGTGTSGEDATPVYDPVDTSYVDTSSISGISDASGVDYSMPDFSDDNVTTAPTGVVDFTTIDLDTGVQEPVVSIDYGGGGDDGYIAPVIVEPEPPAPPPVYYDMFGNEYGSQAEATAADDLYNTVIATPATEAITPTLEAGFDVDVGAGDGGADLDPASMYETSILREANVPIPESYMPTSEEFMPGITGTGEPVVDRTTEQENAVRALYDLPPIVDVDEILGGGDDLVETTPTEADELALELGLPDIGLVDPEEDMNLFPVDIRDPEEDANLFPVSVRDPEEDVNLFPVDIRDPEEDVGLIPDVTTPEDFRRAEAELAGIDVETGAPVGGEADREATEEALMDAVKARVSEVEGTSDEGGYDRLLGGQEDRFGITPTEMTVAEVLEFQKARGEGTYADYAKDAVGRISTPVGKYQVVGTTLQGLIDAGVVDEDDMFDAETQEKIGSYLIENRGLFDEGITDEQFVENLGKEFEGIERFGYDGDTGGAEQRQESIAAVSQKVPTAEITQIQEQLAGAIEPSLMEQGLALGAELLIPGFGGMIAEQLRTVGPEERQAIVDQHVRALESGATPLYDADGNYTGFDRSTMGTFADEVLAADDITAFLPPREGMDAAEIARRADADQDGIPDVERFGEVFEAQQAAADADPYGLSTEEGFIMTGDDGQVGTEDDREFFVTSGGDVVEVRGDGEGEDRDIVDLDLSPDDVEQVINDVLGITEEEDEGDEPINPCPEGYILDPETNECVPIADVGEGGDGEGTGKPRFGDVEREIIRRPEGPTPEEVEGLIIRTPSFAQGGPVTRNIDSFVRSMRG